MKNCFKILIFICFIFSIKTVSSFPSINVIPYCYKDGKTLFLLYGENSLKCSEKGLLFGSFYAEIGNDLDKNDAINLGADFVWLLMLGLNLVLSVDDLKEKLYQSLEIFEVNPLVRTLKSVYCLQKRTGKNDKHIFFLKCDYVRIPEYNNTLYNNTFFAWIEMNYIITLIQMGLCDWRGSYFAECYGMGIRACLNMFFIQDLQFILSKGNCNFVPRSGLENWKRKI